jgi:hypothetical protein
MLRMGVPVAVFQHPIQLENQGPSAASDHILQLSVAAGMKLGPQTPMPEKEHRQSSDGTQTCGSIELHVEMIS